jgi:DNA gyrase subunit B
LFFRYFRPLVDLGHIYIAQSPLYKIKKGKEVSYFYNDEDKNKYLEKEGLNPEEVEPVEDGESIPEESEITEEEENEGSGRNSKVKASKIHVQRYKGLGEMNAEELWETTMDPARRILKQVTVEDAADADIVFDMLMGTDVPARKSFIQSNAKLANLDV